MSHRVSPIIGLCTTLLAGSLFAGTAGAQTGSTQPPAAVYTFQRVLSPADMTFTQLLGINTAGVIAGYHTNVPGNKGLTYNLTSQAFTDENYPNSAQTQVVGINQTGVTVGFYIDPAGTTHGFWANGPDGAPFRNIDNQGTTFNQLLGDSGAADDFRAVGYSMNANASDPAVQNPYVVAWNRRASSLNFNPVQIDMPSGQATDINAQGMVVGFEQAPDSTSTTSQGYMWDSNSGQITPLNFPGSTFTQALGINDNPGAPFPANPNYAVVGLYNDANGNTHGFLYQNGGFQSIDVPGATATTVNGINDNGCIVGFFQDPNQNNNTIGLIGVPNGAAITSCVSNGQGGPGTTAPAPTTAAPPTVPVQNPPNPRGRQ